MNWLFLTIAAISARATYSIATKILSKDVEVSPITHSMLLTAFAAVLSILISPLIGGISFAGIDDYLFGVLVMIGSQTLGNVLFFKGIKGLDAGTTQIAFSSILIWGALLSVMFLGSMFSLVQIAGILLMLIAILTVQYKSGSLDMNSSVINIIGSAISFSIFQVASADLSQVINTGAYLVIAYLGPTIVIGIFYMNQLQKDYKKLQHQVKNSFLTTLFASGTSLLYFVFSYRAYRNAPDSGVMIVLLTAQVVLSVIFGIIFLKENDNLRRKLFAGVLAFIAGVLIKT